LSWLEASGHSATLKFSERTATGWTAPQVITAEDGILVNAADVPLVQPLANRTLVAQWVRARPGSEALDVRVSWSTNGGRAWSAPVTPHHDGTATEHGFAAIFPAAGPGLFGMIWLDGRAPTKDVALMATSFTPEGKQASEVVVDPRACECCQTAAAISADGPVVVYRDRSAGEVRDISVVRLAGTGWSAPSAVHADGWKIAGCPVNGPAIAASGRDIAVAWFTVQEGKGRVLTAFSRDGGRTFAPPIRVDDGEGLGKVQVALLPGGAAAVSWIESGPPGGRQVRVRRVSREGKREAATRVADGSGSEYPRMVARPDELIFAWAEDTRGTTRVLTSRAAVRPF
jgi:hypothetical protein